jgi:site-specific recombinase XerD
MVSKGKCSDGPHCEKWTLHKWRYTFATNMLRFGLDIKSRQELLGHKNIATAEKYLRSLRLTSLRSKVEDSSIGAMLG